VSAIILASSTAGRIGHLVRLLGSDKSGEIVAAASAIKRTLRSAGLDMHALALVTERALTVPERPAPTYVDPALNDDVNFMVRFCLERDLELSDRELKFVRDIERQARRFGDRLELSPKQDSWLQSIFERLRYP
jgi:hypothetical protein